MRKYATVMVARGNLKRTFHRAVSSLAEYEPDFVQVAKEMIDKNRMHDVILVDKVNAAKVIDKNRMHNVILVDKVNAAKMIDKNRMRNVILGDKVNIAKEMIDENRMHDWVYKAKLPRR